LTLLDPDPYIVKVPDPDPYIVKVPDSDPYIVKVPDPDPYIEYTDPQHCFFVLIGTMVVRCTEKC